MKKLLSTFLLIFVAFHAFSQSDEKQVTIPKKIYIGDNDLLKSHLLNSAIKMSTERGRGKLVKLSPSLHIDGTAALLDAMTVRQKWYGEIGQQLQNTED